MNKRVLVLNADMRPLTVIGARRAVRLALEQRVVVLAEYEDTYATPSTEFRLPAVILLNQYVNRPFNPMAVTRAGIFARDNGECQYCGGKAENLDHVVPRSRGGKHTWENVVAACIRCNSKKADLLLANCGLTLRTTPVRPKIHYRFFKNAEPEWLPYLNM